MGTIVEIRFGTYDTRRNLPLPSGRRRGEALFLGAFLRALVQKSSVPHVCARNFSVPACGVADCISLQFDSKDPTNVEAARLVAFEAKLSDWRRALAQAYRYRYYAELAVVVLPADVARRAVQNRSIFKQAGVALWTFDPSTGSIVTRIAAKETPALNPQKKEHALCLFKRRSIQLRKLRESTESF